MLEHNGPPPNDQTAAILRNLRDNARYTHSADGSLIGGDNLLNEAAVEDYLDHIYAPMVGAVSYSRRQEIRRDMRAHLGQLIAAHEELGSDSEEATRAALRQFGLPTIVAQKWLDELPIEASTALCREPLVKSVRRTFGSAASKLALSVSLWVVCTMMLDRYLNGGLITLLYLALSATLPFCVGFVTGRKHAASQPVIGMLIAQAMTLPFWPFLLMFLLEQFRHVGPDMTSASIMAVVSFSALAPTGCLGAWLGARKSRAGHRRRAAAK